GQADSSRGLAGDRVLSRVEGGDHLGGMTLRLDPGPAPGNPAVGVDEERASGDAPVRLAVVLLLDPRPVGVGDGVVGVGEESEWQAELLAEAAVARCALGADPPDVRAALVDRLVRVAELARLDGAAGRVVLGVEVDDRPATLLIGKSMDCARLVGERDG